MSDRGMVQQLKAGQTVFVERLADRWRQLPNAKVEPVTVTKVGKRWATISYGGRPERFDIEADDEGLLWLDGGDHASPGRVWLSEHDHGEFVRRTSAWDQIAERARRIHRMPALPAATLEAFAAALSEADES